MVQKYGGNGKGCDAKIMYSEDFNKFTPIFQSLILFFRDTSSCPSSLA